MDYPVPEEYKQKLEPLIRRLHIVLYNAHIHAAHKIIDEAETILKESQQNITIKHPITHLGLNTKKTNALENAGIQTIEQLLHKTPKELQQIKEIGTKTLPEIGEQLHKLKIIKP